MLGGCGNVGGYRLSGPQAVGIVGVGDGGSAVGCGYQLSAVVPFQGPAGAIIVAGGIAGAVIGDGLPVKGSQQILPVGVAVGIGMAIGGENITDGVVGIGVGRITGSAEQLALIVIGIGNHLAIRGRIGCDVAQVVIGVAKAKSITQVGIAELGNLHGGCRAGNIPVGIAAVEGSSGDRTEAAQTVVPHGKGISNTGGHGVQAAVSRVVGVGFGVSGAAHLPTLLGHLIILIEVLICPQGGGSAFLLLTGNQTTKGVIGVQIGCVCTIPGFFDAVEPSFAVISIRQDTTIGVGGGFGAAQVIVGKGDAVAVGVGLALQQAVAGAVGIGCQRLTTNLQCRHIAEGVIGKAIGLGTGCIICTLYRTQITAAVIIYQTCDTCNTGSCNAVIGIVGI